MLGKFFKSWEIDEQSNPINGYAIESEKEKTIDGWYCSEKKNTNIFNQCQLGP
jgi:hypothetical protein